MVDNNFSCIKEVTKIVQITLPAACTSNEIGGISDVLESWKRQYIQQLKAVVVSYKNVSLVSSRGFIKLDLPFVLHHVKATFELFYPSVGSIVKGKINRISHDYIGCLVHNTINVTIDRSSNSTDFPNFIALDRFILFEITQLGFKRKIIHVKGKVSQECVRLMRECDIRMSEANIIGNGFMETSLDENEDIESHIELENNIFNNNISGEVSTDSGHHSPKEKKLHSIPLEKNSPSKSNIQNSYLELENSTDTSSHRSSSSKKKKHKKPTLQSLSSPPLFNESLESDVCQTGLKKKHKSKAEIKDNVSDVTGIENILNVKNELETDDSSSNHISPKKKKSKKSKVSSPQKSLITTNVSLENSIDAKHVSSHANTDSPKKKKSKKSKVSSSEKKLITKSLVDSIDAKHISSSTKKRKHKKSKDHSSKSLNKSDPTSPPKKKRKKSKSETPSMDLQNISSPLNIKKEIHNSPRMSPLKSSNSSNNFSESYKDVYEMIEALASFEPPPEAQLLGNNVLTNTIKQEPVDMTKTTKKRKLESLDNSLPKKKRKIKDGKSASSKSKDEKSKKKKKEKSKKDSKKDKKLKKKIISTKKKLHGYENKLKKKKKEKPEKSKTKKGKKSDKHKTKKVPSPVSIKSEI